ncbi:MAG: hypothetical protein ACTSR8_04845 [Promethearchaeota archaeon]
MIKIYDQDVYKNYRENKAKLTKFQVLLNELLIPCLIFGSLGAITWAIRGTSGWGGFDGALVPGFTYALLIYYFLYKRGIDARSIVFWLGLGIAVGGMWGYGQYVSWIQGTFYVNGVENTRSISPTIGYLWFWLCGATWGGVGGIFLGWALGKNATLRTWLKRIIIPLILAISGYILILIIPSVFLPFYEQGIYSDGSCTDCNRTYDTNVTTFIAVMWWVGALITATSEKDKDTFKYGLIMGIGFGIAFMISAIWTLGYVIAPEFTDWWKVWECFMGFFGGIILVYVLFLIQKGIDQNYDQNGVLIENLDDKISTEDKVLRLQIFPYAKEEYQTTSLSLSLSVLIWIAILHYGMTYMLGVNLGLYSNDTSDQYELPLGRMILVLVGAVLLFIWFAHRYHKIIKTPKNEAINLYNILDLDQKVFLGIVYIGFVGFITIWPSNIWILYISFSILSIIGYILLEKL